MSRARRFGTSPASATVSIAIRTKSQIFSGNAHRRGTKPRRSAGHLSDFSIAIEALWLVPLALVVGALAAVASLGLLAMIGLVTHLAYYQTVGWRLIAPDPRQLGAVSILIPVAGGLIIGAMAFWGSERIRGHGIPEAMETILVGGSRVEPRLATLKPLSSAISIGTGGPFGAEGPIILTGGALGSVLAQHFHLSAIERRTLLVAGACAGMAAVFGTPVAAVLFGVELLVFELKPRSFVPIALAVTVASVARQQFVGQGWIQPTPLFPVPDSHLAAVALIGAAVVGVVAGLFAGVLTAAVYAAEDAFSKLPIHWAWWPALGGIVIGVGGLDRPTRARRRLLDDRRGVGRSPRRKRAGNSSDHQAHRVVHRPRLGDQRRHPRAAPDDGCRSRWPDGSGAPGRRSLRVGDARYGGNHGRRDPLAADRFGIRV